MNFEECFELFCMGVGSALISVALGKGVMLAVGLYMVLLGLALHSRRKA